jgi:hypothetical protein
MTLTDDRRALANEYGISYNDEGVYTAITPTGAADLIFSFLSQITETMRQMIDRRAKYGLSDDDYDYINALADQFKLWHELEFWGMDHETPVTDEILRILNMTPEEARHTFAFEDNQGNWYGLKYGYADHATHFSDLAHMNDD